MVLKNNVIDVLNNRIIARGAIVKYLSLSRSRHEPGYNALNEVVIEKATYT